MKIVLIFLLLFSAQLFSSDINTLKSYDEAIKLAQKDNKNIILVLSQTGCKACTYMYEVTFKNDDVKLLLKNYILLPVDVYKDSWNKKFRPFGTPTIYFVDKNENKIGRPVIGALESSDFIKVIKEIESKK